MSIGAIVTVLLSLAIVGFLLWLIVTYIPMPEPFKKVIIVVMVIVLILWLLSYFGVMGGGGGGPVLNLKK